MIYDFLSSKGHLGSSGVIRGHPGSTLEIENFTILKKFLKISKNDPGLPQEGQTPLFESEF